MQAAGACLQRVGSIRPPGVPVTPTGHVRAGSFGTRELERQLRAGLASPRLQHAHRAELKPAVDNPARPALLEERAAVGLLVRQAERAAGGRLARRDHRQRQPVLPHQDGPGGQVAGQRTRGRCALRVLVPDAWVASAGGETVKMLHPQPPLSRRFNVDAEGVPPMTVSPTATWHEDI